jgi:hypothetical protein
MYRPESNYLLALTGGLSYLFNAYVAYRFGSVSAAFASAGLALTSIWFHISRDDTSFWLDQMFVHAYGTIALKESWDRGFIECGLVVLGVLFSTLLYYAGQIGNCYTFSPEIEVATAYHASLHMGSAVLVSSVLAGSNVLLLTDMR